MTGPLPHRKRIRLETAHYADPSAICSITITVAGRLPIFEHRALTAESLKVLERRASLSGVDVRAFCFMPDHLHLLLSPSPGTSLIDFVRDFKGETTHLAWRYGHEGKLWQRAFYDHFLRRDEDIEHAVRYILENPVRAGLVQDVTGYEFSGPELGTGRAQDHWIQLNKGRGSRTISTGVRQRRRLWPGGEDDACCRLPVAARRPRGR